MLRLARRDLLTIANAADSVRRHLSVSEAAARMDDERDNPYLDVLRARWRAALEQAGPSRIELAATANDIVFMNDVLNEVCNAFPSEVDFPDEIGTDRATAARLLDRIHRAVHTAQELARQHGLPLAW